MPRPGGGGNSGGFGGGSRGGFGGGHHGGGYYGGHHHHHHRPGFYGPRYGMFGFGPRWYRPYYGGYYGGGGCLGGLLGIIMLPFILIFIAAIMLLSSVGAAFSGVASGGEVIYNERTFQSYALEEYAREFGENDSTYEDNILLAFTVNETCDAYYAIAIVGENVADDIYEMFGNQYTQFGVVTKATIPKYYEFTLYDDIARIANKMADRIEGLGLSSSFIDPSVGTKTSSHLTNNSTLSMDVSHTDKALKEFTEKTGIPLVVVVDDEVSVFGKTQNAADWITVIISLVLIGLAIYLIVRNILDKKQAKKNGGNGNGGNNGNNGGGYYDAGTGNYYSNQ